MKSLTVSALIAALLLLPVQSYGLTFFVTDPQCDPSSCRDETLVMPWLSGQVRVEVIAEFISIWPIASHAVAGLGAPDGCNGIDLLTAWGEWDDAAMDYTASDSSITASATCSGTSCEYYFYVTYYGDNPLIPDEFDEGYLWC